MQNKYSLFLDDFRNPNEVWWVKLPQHTEWKIARTMIEFTRTIEKNGIPEFVSFDHDLDRDLNGVVKPQVPGEFDGVNSGNGLDCAEWLINMCDRTSIPFPVWTCHSTNPTSGPKIAAKIQEYLKTKN